MGAIRVLLAIVAVVFAVFTYQFVFTVYDHPGNLFGKTNVAGREIKFSRGPDGVLKFVGEGEVDFVLGIGYAHAKDRLVQMLLQRTIALGRLSQDLAATPETIAIDKIFKEQNFIERGERVIAKMSRDQLEIIEKYCEGVNTYINSLYFPPLEFILTGFPLEPWRPVDCFLAFQLITYAGLSSIQLEVEKFIIELIHTTPLPSDQLKDYLKEFFVGEMGSLNDNLINEIKSLKEYKPFLATTVIQEYLKIESLGSNNWVVSGEHTESTQPLQANDPHLQIDRLPGVFYESIYNSGSEFAMGVSIPGFPAMLMGRTNYISYGLTYGVMDQHDYFIEELVDGHVKRPNNKLVAVKQRIEILKAKGKEDEILYFYDTEDGCTLDLVQNYKSVNDIPNGNYLSWKWSWDFIEPKHVDGMHFYFYKNVKEAMASMKNVPVSCNYVFADHLGNIGYQQSGLLPARGNRSLILPSVASTEGIWESIHDADDLVKLYNPESGYVVTTNNNVQLFEKDNKIRAISAHLGGYRYKRGTDILDTHIKNKHKLTVQDMIDMQNDEYSLRAERIVPIIKPYLSSEFNELLDWDFKYQTASRGGLLFDLIYSHIVSDLVGNNLFNNYATGQFLMQNTTMKIILYHYIDDIFVENAPQSPWFKNVTREEVINRAISNVLKHPIKSTWVKDKKFNYGNVFMPITYKNIFFQGTLPSWTGYDVGPIIQPGNQATLRVGDHRGKFKSKVNVAAAWKYVADMAEQRIHTTFPGGPSGNRFSRYYTSGLSDYMNNNYKIITPF